jgi:hypothetical protein
MNYYQIKSDLKMKMNNFGSQPLWVPLIFQKTVKATTNPPNKIPLYFCAKDHCVKFSERSVN